MMVMKNRLIIFWNFLIVCSLFLSCASAPEKKEAVQQVDSSTVVQTHFTKIKLEPEKFFPISSQRVIVMCLFLCMYHQNIMILHYLR